MVLKYALMGDGNIFCVLAKHWRTRRFSIVKIWSQLSADKAKIIQKVTEVRVEILDPKAAFSSVKSSGGRP